jgi:hypothetical protein
MVDDPTSQDTARQAVWEAAQRLRRDADALNAASPATREAGVQARVEDLRAAALSAWDHGVGAPAIAADAGLDTAVVERWIAMHTFGDRPSAPGQ